MQKKAIFLTFALLCASAIATASPIYTAYEFGPGTGNQNWTGSLGMDFTVVEPAGISVISLGAFASGLTQIPDGQSLTVQLYDITAIGTPQLLTQVTFTSSNDGTLVGNAFFQSLATPVFLSSGTVGSIVAYGYGAGIPNGNSMSDPALYGTINEVGIEMGGWRYAPAGNTSFPTTTGGPLMSEMRFGAGTFQLHAVPEPGSWTLAAIGIALAAFPRKLIRRPRN